MVEGKPSGTLWTGNGSHAGFKKPFRKNAVGMQTQGREATVIQFFVQTFFLKKVLDEILP